MHDADPVNAVGTAAETLAADGAATLAELRPDLEVVRALGRGSTADVYLAREPALQRLVAVKVLRAELAADAVMRKRFEREAQSAARIAHPHVTAVHRVGRLSNDVPYIVMEYVDGRTVAEMVAARGAFAPVEARELLESVAAALAAAHDHGIVHRDVRAANIFVENRTGRAVLGDFGIAALLASGTDAATRLTAAGIRLGETRSMSPEQLCGAPVTEQSDVYSFGLLAYEVLTGRGPYDAKTDAQLMVAHMTLEPKPVRTLRPEVDAPWLPLVERCLAKDPNRRPRAGELAAALAVGPSAATATHTAPGTLQHFLDEVRRRRMYQVLGAYAAVAFGVLGVAGEVFQAFDRLSRSSYQLIVLVTLAGFPVALVLGWLYDVSATGIHRTGATASTRRSAAIKWAGLALSVLVAAVAGWLLLRRG
jgi:serine/threonine-protein kinase